jgi:hypothetical protein
MGIRRQTTVRGRLEVKRAWNGGALRYFVATFTPLRPFASIAFCTTAVRFASSTSVASAACASSERPFGSAAATRTIANAPGTIFCARQGVSGRISDARVRPKDVCLAGAQQFGCVTHDGRAQRDTDDLTTPERPEGTEYSEVPPEEAR